MKRRSMVMRNPLAPFVCGGIAFWGPALALVSPRYELGWGDVALLLIAVPLISLAACRLLDRLLLDRSSRGARPRRTAVLFLFGVWALGPTAMFVQGALNEGSPVTAECLQLLVVATMFFPIYTVFLSAYGGTLLPLLVVTLILLVRMLQTGRSAEALR